MPSTTPTARRILVVCLGNHCRSPLAAAVLARRGEKAVEIRSAGLTHHHVDRPAHPLMLAAARELGYDLSEHRGVQLTADLLTWADLILAMDRAVAEQLQQRMAPADPPKIHTYLTGSDVPDPWGKTADDFAACAALIVAGAAQHLPLPNHDRAIPSQRAR